MRLKFFSILVILATLFLAWPNGAKANDNGINLDGYILQLQYCDDLIPIDPSDNSFDLSSYMGRPDFIFNIQNPSGEWATIQAHGATSDGLAAHNEPCHNDPNANDIYFTDSGNTEPLTIYWDSNSGFVVEVHRDQNSNTVWLTTASEVVPVPTPMPAPIDPPNFDINCNSLDYDANANGRLEDPEFFRAVDDWVGGNMADSCFFRMVDAWIGQTPLASAKISPANLMLQVRGQTISFALKNATSLQVFVYDLQGELVGQAQPAASRVNVKLSSSNGRPLANGVYIYEVRAKLANGSSFEQTKMIKILR